MAVNGTPRKVAATGCFSSLLGLLAQRRCTEGASPYPDRENRCASEESVEHETGKCTPGGKSAPCGLLLSQTSTKAGDDEDAPEDAQSLASWSSEPEDEWTSHDEGRHVALDENTTVHVRNLPGHFTRSAVESLLDQKGFAGRYDFVYLPMDFRSKQSIGCAVVNFGSSSDALLFCSAVHGFSQRPTHSDRVCIARLSQTQGYEANVHLVHTSGAARQHVPDEYRPAVYAGGHIVPFPKSPNDAISGTPLAFWGRSCCKSQPGQVSECK